MANKLIGGGCLLPVLYLILCFVLHYFLFGDQPPEVPYGSALPMPLFYSGILGAVIGAMIHLVSKGKPLTAAAMALIGSGLTAWINWSYWMGSAYPRFHYFNVIILVPVIVMSALIGMAGLALLIGASVSCLRGKPDKP